ncbi:MAG: translation initiation factor IF-2 [Coriobacteriia bacterium]|nr:translation initiation factor IF-2 [Coriobacteriia bacterium]
MPAMRVHELAKEFGMTSKELLDHLARLKIPARNHASTLVEAYVDKIRKDLHDEIASKQAEMETERLREEAERMAEEEIERAREAEARAKLDAEEAERLAAEAARLAEEDAARKAEEEARAKADEAQRLREAEEHAKRDAEEAIRKEAEQRAAEERALLAEAAAKEEAAEADRYRQMAKDAEAVAPAAPANLITEAAKMVQSDSDKRKRKTKKPSGRREAATHAHIVADEKPQVAAVVVTLVQNSTVAEFADAAGVTPGEVIKRLMMLGDMHTVNQPMSRDAMEILAEDLGIEVIVVSPAEEQSFVFEDDPEDLKARPPVVTVMGHVDHGKTSLLDAIRETGVVDTEAGGITQHIGASVVERNGKQITFIDTPGHEAFTAMRARGANITDIVILVVAADDGVMPQTVEAIHHAKAAGVPIIVAVNKIDKDGANPEQVKQMLTEHEIVPEEWGGPNIFVNVSAKKRIAIEDLLEMVLLQAEVLELQANPDTFASGVVIEANLDKGRGPVATVLVQRGTLQVGDSIVAGTSHGRVRALVNPLGETVETAGPADPVEVQGLSSVPSAGDEFRVFADERDARNLAEERSLKQRLLAHERKSHVTLDDLFTRIQQGEIKDLNLVVKADVQGSIEALKDALDKMKQDEVHINVIHSGVGGITESDVMLATASDAIIIGFNVRPLPEARDLAAKEKVDMRMYRVIYQAIEEINAARVGMLAPTIEEQETAHVEVRDLFKVPKLGTIAGCFVQDGEIARDDRIRIVRDGTIIHDGKLHSLRRFKDDVKSVKQGYECGIGIENFQDIKVGDVIESYKTIEVAREE